MLYTVRNDFMPISESSGTIQNNSSIYDVEVSDKAEVGSGILLHALNKFSFSGTKLYMRCTEGGGWAEIRVVPFLVDFGTVSGDSPATPTDDDTDFLDDAWNGNIVTDPDSDALIDDMWNSSGDGDTGDGFSDALDDIFNP